MSTPIYPQRVVISKPGPAGTAIDPTDPSTPLAVALALGGAAISDSNPTPVKGVGYRATVDITRPSNTTAYNAGDALGIADAGTPANAGSAILEFANIGPSGGHILLTGADLRIDLAAITSGMTSFRLYIYDEAPAAILDNAVWDFAAADRGKLLGFIDFGNIADLVSTLFAQADGVNKQFKLKAASTSLFGVLVTNGGYTPASGTTKSIRLRSVAA